MCVFLYIRQHTEDYSYFHTIGQHQFNSMHANARTAAAIYLNEFRVKRYSCSAHKSWLPCSITSNVEMPTLGAHQILWGDSPQQIQVLKGAETFRYEFNAV